MNYEVDSTYYNENGMEITIIGKLGNRYTICYGSYLGDMLGGSTIFYVTQAHLDRHQLSAGTFSRNNCRCGYKSETPFGTVCPQCNETAQFYSARDAFNALPPMEDLLLGDRP